MLGDSLTFQLSSLAPLKEQKKKKKENLDPPKKGPISKMSMTLLALIFKSSMHVILSLLYM